MLLKYRKIDKKGNINIPTETVVNGKKVLCDLSKIDMWIVYCPDNKKIYYINTKELLGKKQLSLRVNEPKQIQNTMKFAKNYLDIKKAWKVNL